MNIPYIRIGKNIEINIEISFIKKNKIQHVQGPIVYLHVHQKIL